MRRSPALILIAGLGLASTFAAPPNDPLEAPFETPEQRAERMRWWQEARFGLFIHWGPVSVMGTEIGWSRGGERRGRAGIGEVPVEIYDDLYRHFNPVHFDADEWVRIAQAAGMKYMVFTTKHHDGFCNFNSRLTDYKITSPESPFGRDIVAELARACHKAGLPLGLYYSPPDWYHPDYRTEKHAEYIKYMHGQLRELCTNYGKVSIIWFDGLGGTAEDWDSHRMLAMIRELQPGVIINRRGGLAADHDTPEQTIGAFRNDRPWETCMTICTQWSWRPDDRLKSLKECLHTLVRTAGGDGNLLFNVGPRPDGRFEPEQVARLKEMGEWLARYGESIYGTRGGPFKYSPFGQGRYTSTHKGNRIYVHVLAWPRDDAPLELPPIARKVIASSVLTGGTVTVAQSPEAITVSLPVADRREIDTIIVLELDGPASDIPPVAAYTDLISEGKPAAASNFYRGQREYAARRAVDGDPETRWATDTGTQSAWLEVDFESVQIVGSAWISEAFPGRVQEFVLERRVEGEWVPFYRGTHIGEHAKIEFEPVTTRKVRLNILRATDGPSIWEFQLCAPASGAKRR